MLWCSKFMESLRPSDQQLHTLFKQYAGFLTRQQADAAGLEPHTLTRWVEKGWAERVQRGVYRQAETALGKHEGILEVQLRIPYSVLCLDSALAFHGLTTFIPKKLSLAVPRGKKPPKLEYPSMTFYFFSQGFYTYGIEQHTLGVHELAVYSPEKTLADLLRYKHKLGSDLFAEGLKRYLERRGKKRGPDLAKLLAAAKVCRVEAQMRDYLEVVSYDTSS
jgi:predicted transcriptional regulator of viral defense system